MKLALPFFLLFLISCKSDKQFTDNCKSLIYQIKGTTAIAGSINNLYKVVWYNAIFKSADYVNPSSKYYFKDYNKALAICREDEQGGIEVMQSHLNTIDSLMKLINDPPEKYLPLKNNFIDLYGLLNQFSSLAETPKGSLNSFTETCNQLSSNIDSKIKEVEIQLP